MRPLILALIFVLSACTTSRYGDAPTATGEPDTYRFKVYVGGFSGEESASKALAPDLEQFRAARGYRGFSVVNRFYNPFPSYFDYTVRFSR